MPTSTIIRCPNCGANNRVAIELAAGGVTPVCGRCKTPLPTAAGSGGSARPIVVTDATFAEQVEKSPLPVLVDLWAPWCGPCRMIAPILDQLAGEMSGRFRFAKLNVDENPATAGRFNVNSIPTLLIMRGGREIDRIVGLAPAPEIRRRLESAA